MKLGGNKLRREGPDSANRAAFLKVRPSGPQLNRPKRGQDGYHVNRHQGRFLPLMALEHWTRKTADGENAEYFYNETPELCWAARKTRSPGDAQPRATRPHSQKGRGAI